MAVLAYETIVVLVILGACVAFAICYSMTRLCTSDFDTDDSSKERSDTQKKYMKEVQVRNFNALWEQAMAERRHKGKNKAGAPVP